MNRTPIPQQKFFESGLLIPLFTASSYLSSFYYARAFFLYAGVPSSFITISITSILSTAGLSFVAISLISVISLFYSIIIKKAVERQIVVKTLLNFLFVFVGLCFFSLEIVFAFPRLPIWASILISLIFVSFSTRIIYIISKRERLSQRSEVQTSPTTAHVQKGLNLLYSDLRISIVIVLTFQVLIYSMLGEIAVRQSDVFWVCGTKNKAVVVCRSDDYMFCRPYDEKTNTVGDSLIMIRLSENSKLSFKPIIRRVDFSKIIR